MQGRISIRFPPPCNGMPTLLSHPVSIVVWGTQLKKACGSFMFLFCLVFAMSLCASVYMCFVVTCWERADLLALVCGVLL